MRMEGVMCEDGEEVMCGGMEGGDVWGWKEVMCEDGGGDV